MNVYEEVRWPNGSRVTKDEALDVLMYYNGEHLEDARQSLKAIDKAALQRAVNYYAEHVD